jgi:LmbE family N-acetylglucosaminyl deacetylase
MDAKTRTTRMASFRRGAGCNRASGWETSLVSFTIVAFHAHPDDEALLTGGTLARAAAEGHRIVLVTATAGEAGLSAEALQQDGRLAERRLAELRQSAAALGCARVVLLGYPDSGWGVPTDPSVVGAVPFAMLDPAEPAARLAEILREEQAEVLTIYDERGGYGHPDHIQVHQAGVLAAELAGTPVVLEATVDRDTLRRVARVMAWVPGLSRLVPESRFASAYLPRSEVTHRVDVRRHLAAKRAALSAHATQATGGGSVRTVALLLRLPRPLLGVVLGREWYRERGRPAEGAPLDDIFATLR